MSRLKKRRSGLREDIAEMSMTSADGQKIEKTNRDAIRATIIGGQPINKAEAETAQLPDDPFKAMTASGQAIEPPLDLMVLTMMEENNSELRPVIDAMVTNIEGFGGRLVLPEMPEEELKKNEAEIKAEKAKIKGFLLNFDPEDDITSLRAKSRRELELTGNFYWELIPARLKHDQIVAMKFTEAHTVRITKADDVATPFEKIEIDPESGEVFKQTFFKRFRRFVQIRNNKKVYFKEFADPRIVDRETGKAYKDKAAATAAGLKPEKYAHPIYHGRLWSSRTPYGLPRYVGNLFSIFGSRAADEINYNTFLNNNVPSMAILVSGNAMLTDGTIRRIEEFTNSVMKRSNNYSKFLLIEAEPAVEGLANSGTAKIDIERLKSEQSGDQLFQEYDKNNAEKLRRAFRLPPIYTGKASDYNRGTAETSKKLAEEQIFDTERKSMDRHLNRVLTWMGFKWWKYKSYTPNLTNDEDLIKLINSVEKTGAMTPNLARRIVGDIMNEELKPFTKEQAGFDPEVPFSLTMAEAVKGADASLGGNPQTGKIAPNQGQIPKPNNTEKRFDGLPTDENGDLDMTKLVDSFDRLNKKLKDAVKWEDQNAVGSESSQ